MLILGQCGLQMSQTELCEHFLETSPEPKHNLCLGAGEDFPATCECGACVGLFYAQDDHCECEQEKTREKHPKMLHLGSTTFSLKWAIEIIFEIQRL